jgi:hypothetical protein
MLGMVNTRWRLTVNALRDLEEIAYREHDIMMEISVLSFLGDSDSD